MTAPRADFSVDAGAGATLSFTYCNPTAVFGVPGAPINITGYHASFTVRSSIADGIALELNDTTLGGIAIGGITGQFLVTMTAAQTDQLPERGVYDLLMTPPGGEQPIRLVSGVLKAIPPVTP